MNLVVSYHGTKFIGWQRQSAEIESKPGLLPSVQSVLEDAATSIVDGGIICRSRHRTDRGTHALNHRIRKDFPEQGGMSIRLASPSSHARPTCTTYRYYCKVGRYNRDLSPYVWQWTRGEIDVDKFKECARSLLGVHDFKHFGNAAGDGRTTLRTVYAAHVMKLKYAENASSISGNGIVRLEDFETVEKGLPENAHHCKDYTGEWADGNEKEFILCFEISASGFLKHMVRNIMSSLMRVASINSQVPVTLSQLMQGEVQPPAAAPAKGLWLVSGNHPIPEEFRKISVADASFKSASSSGDLISKSSPEIEASSPFPRSHSERQAQQLSRPHPAIAAGSISPNDAVAASGHLYGNFPRYYDFNPISSRMSLLPEDLVQWAAPFAPGRPLSVLDLGCNTGALSAELHARLSSKWPHGTVHLTGIDIDASLIASARRTFTDRKGLEFEVADVCNIDFGKKFDIVSCFGLTMWIHLHKGDDGLRDWLRKMCKMASVLLLEPHPSKTYKKAKKRLRRIDKESGAFPFGQKLENVQNIEECVLDTVRQEFGPEHTEVLLGRTKWGRSIWIFQKGVCEEKKTF
eukprot:g4020.t1